MLNHSVFLDTGPVSRSAPCSASAAGSSALWTVPVRAAAPPLYPWVTAARARGHGSLPRGAFQ
jgi:hypothetical protein